MTYTRGRGYRGGSGGPKSRPIPYAGDENNVSESQWYRCRRCGFICSTQRDAQDGYGSGAVAVQIDNVCYLTNHPGDYMIDPDGNRLYMEDSGGYDLYESVVTGGCPLCGTYSWKG